MVKTDQTAIDRGYAEGVYALRDTEYIHLNHHIVMPLSCGMVGYKALVGPAPGPEGGIPEWRIELAIGEATMQRALRSARERATDIMTPLLQAGLPGGRPPLRSMKMDASTPGASDLDWPNFRAQKKEGGNDRKPAKLAADHVPVSVEPEGPKRSRSVIRRGGHELMLAEAARNWRECQSGGRRSGWGNIGHGGFDRSFAASCRACFEFPDGMLSDQRPDPRDGAPEFQPPRLPQEAFISMRRKCARASPAAALVRSELDGNFPTFLQQNGVSLAFNGTANPTFLDLDLSILKGAYFAALSPRHVEAHPRWMLPSDQIFTDRLARVTCLFYDWRLAMLQVAPILHAGWIGFLGPGRQILNNVSEDRLDVVLWQGVKEPPTWEDNICLVCLGHKARFGTTARGVCHEEIFYEAPRWQPNRLRPAVDWRHVGMHKEWPRQSAAALHELSGRRSRQKRARATQMQNSDRTQGRWQENWSKDTPKTALKGWYSAMAGKTATSSEERSAFAWDPSSPTDMRLAHGNRVREGKGHTLARRWLHYQECRRQQPTGNNAACPSWKWLAYLPRHVDLTDKGADMGILNISAGGTTDPDAREKFVPSMGWGAWCTDNRELATYFAAAEEPEEHHPAGDVSTCAARIRELWFDPPDFCVYDPDSPSQKARWMPEQVYRLAIKLTKDIAWTELDPETADEDAMWTHLAEVGQCRASLVNEVHLLKAHRDMLDLVYRDMRLNRADAPPISTDAREIEARKQCLQQSGARALRRGLRRTPDTFQRAAVRRWPLHVHEAAVHALAHLGAARSDAAETDRGKRARAEAGDRAAPPPSAKARSCRYTDVREPVRSGAAPSRSQRSQPGSSPRPWHDRRRSQPPDAGAWSAWRGSSRRAGSKGAGKGDRGKGGRDSWGDRRGDGWDWPWRRSDGWGRWKHHGPMALWWLNRFRALWGSFVVPARPGSASGGASGRLAVVLDVDECLVHSTDWADAGGAADGFRQAEAVRPDRADAGGVDSFRLSVASGSDHCTVLKRAGLDEFLRECAELFDVFTFTAGTRPYAEPLLDRLDPEHSLIKGRFYRTDCREVRVPGRGYQYLKDLAAVTGDMRRVVLDNNPMSFLCQPQNGIPIADFVGGGPDGELARVLALLRRLDAEDDVRPVLDGMFALEGKLASLRREFLGAPAPVGGAGSAGFVD
ncbi:unnamed protein product [Prorocentrum cordatum]|uniref:FCP1 homology domain-containing protein n=1 Tax=Prorocentrum cordatum TaxID=2364126 RepID=A0ABN9TTM7_9DINO|nr:unnamed protein product [Polarella glacialis]